MLVALLARYGPSPNFHQISLVSNDGVFKFYADELPDGSHTYDTSYVSRLHWYLAPQHESGTLSEKDWQTLHSLRRLDQLPKAEESQLEEPGETWG